MAVGSVTAPAERPAFGGRPVSARHFARLKLRVTRNNLRGQGWRVGLFIAGLIIGLWLAATGFFLFAAAGLGDNRDLAPIIAAFGGGLLVLGWLFLPLVFFGVDETLDPARFALLPLSRRTLVTGLLAAALIGTPAVATLLATVGLVLTAWSLGGWSAGLVELVGVIGGLLVCVAASRALTSAFATMLRSRRVRDLAAVLLAVFAGSLGPLQIGVLGAAQRTDWTALGGVARAVGWTPLAAPYTIGLDVAEGRAWAVPVKLVIIIATIGLLLWWWSRSLETAMVGAASSGAAPKQRAVTGSAVHEFVPWAVRWLRPDRHGALVAREARYWYRDTRRRSGLITFAVVGIFVPAMMNIGSAGLIEGRTDSHPSPTTLALSMLFVGILAAVSLANQFGYDGSAYAANMIAGVPGRLELRARLVAFSLYIVPLLVVISVVVAVLLGEPGWIGLVAGTIFASYGSGLAVNLYVSILGAYALPETSNPFAINTGAGVTKGLLALVGMLASAAVAVPMVVAGALLQGAWLWLAFPVGVVYGLTAVGLGTYLAGDVLDRRMPELLQAVTPRR